MTNEMRFNEHKKIIHECCDVRRDWTNPVNAIWYIDCGVGYLEIFSREDDETYEYFCNSREEFNSYVEVHS